MDRRWSRVKNTARQLSSAWHDVKRVSVCCFLIVIWCDDNGSSRCTRSSPRTPWTAAPSSTTRSRTWWMSTIRWRTWSVRSPRISWWRRILIRPWCSSTARRGYQRFRSLPKWTNSYLNTSSDVLIHDYFNRILFYKFRKIPIHRKWLIALIRIRKWNK